MAPRIQAKRVPVKSILMEMGYSFVTGQKCVDLKPGAAESVIIFHGNPQQGR
jgi:hypothetical protein